MHRSLYWKLALSFVLVAFTTAGLVALFVRLTNQDRLAQLVMDQQRSSMQQVLADYYAAVGSWNDVEADWSEIVLSSMRSAAAEPPADAPGPPSPNGRQTPFGLVDGQGVVMVPVDPKYPAGSTMPSDTVRLGGAVTVDGKQVGTVVTIRQAPGFSPEEAHFLERTDRALLQAVLGATLVAIVMAILLARTLAYPLRALTAAAQRIAQGDLEQQVRVGSQDEMGQLATAFNRMSQEVARGNQLRRQMTADIAHDLRTPLTVIAGYVESMRDGVLQPTPRRLSLIYTEIERLQNLVGDLRMLSQADAGELPLNPQHIAARDLLDRAAELFRYQAEQQQVRLLVDASDNLPELYVDEARIVQVLDNLISNALRYTPTDGSIRLAAEAMDGRVRISVRDTGSGIAPEELPLIFDRFHRADRSRSAEAGGTGLGLAIVKALVESHGGSVAAESVVGGGTSIYVDLPA